MRAEVRALGTGEFVERTIQEADAELRRQIPLEVRLERAKEYIFKACEEEGVSLRQMRVCTSAIWRAISRRKLEDVSP